MLHGTRQALMGAIRIGWLEYFNQDSVLAGEIDVSAKENFVNRKER